MHGRHINILLPRSGVWIALLLAASCGASPPSENATSKPLTALEIHKTQTSTRMEVSRIVEGRGKLYAVPSAPYVRLGEVGRGTPTAYYQAWITFSHAVPTQQIPGRKIPAIDRLTASVSFNQPDGVDIFPSPTAEGGWVHSDTGIPEHPNAELWLETTQCENDRPPKPSTEPSDLNVKAVFSIAGTQLRLSCSGALNPPNGRVHLICVGGSAPTSSGLKYGFYGVTSVEKGCRAALEELARSFAAIPLIVDDWRLQ